MGRFWSADRRCAHLRRRTSRGGGFSCVLGLCQIDGETGRVPDDRGAGGHEPADWAMGRPRRSRPGTCFDRAGEHPGAGTGSLQEIDQSSVFEAVTAWSQSVLHDSKHAELMTLTLKHATVQRGVAHLIFSDEVQVLPASDEAEASSPDGRLGDVEITPAEASVASAADLIRFSRRPTIIVGHGAREAMADVVALAEKLNAPVMTTFKAKGQVSDAHPLAGGVLGRSGTPIASSFMNEADLLIVFGASFFDHTGIERSKPIILVDFDQLALGKFHPVTVPVWWEIGLSSASIFEVLTEVIAWNAVIAVDVGNNTYSFGRYFECGDQQSVLMSGFLGSIGFGFPAAMGAWAAAPDRPIGCVTGDGGFGQYMGEFTMAVKYGMNITHILLNNNELGKISKEQRAGEWQVWQTCLQNPNSRMR